MEIQSLIDLLTGASAPTVLALMLAISLWVIKIIASALMDSWKARLEDAKAYTKSTEKIAELIGRGQGEK
jgi:hypothetical protein